MQQTHDETRSTNNEQQQARSTGPDAKKARLETVLPTALVGPAQQGREPCPIILPRIAIGVSVAPYVPVLPAAAPLALEHQGSLVLTPLTNEEKGEETGAHQQHHQEEGGVGEPLAPPKASPEQERGYPVITTPIPTPGDLHHTTPFPSSPVVRQIQHWSPRHQRLFLVGLGSGLLLYLLVLVLVAVFVAPVVTLAATVTLVPETKTLSTTLTVTALSTGTPDQARKQVAARLLSVSSPTQSQTVPTTGIGHAPARVGEGTVIFYNAAPYSQTVVAGTLLTGADGIEIVTDAPAAIPAGNPPTFGIATVPAHAAVIGPQGNIAPLDLNGLCCIAGISVKNTTAFHDGQDAYDYPMVTQADIDQAARPLLATLTPETQASLQAEVHPNERLVGQVGCQPAVTPDHPVGSDASQVTVSVSVICHAQVYDYEAVVRLVNTTLMQQATTTLGTDYALRGTISTTITQAGAPPHAKPGTLTLLVTGLGVWVYQVSTAEQARLTKLLAGLSRQAAVQVLQQQEAGHLAGIHIQITGLWASDTTLPTNPTRIHLLVATGV
jgi:hypothetical protein